MELSQLDLKGMIWIIFLSVAILILIYKIYKVQKMKKQKDIWEKSPSKPNHEEYQHHQQPEQPEQTLDFESLKFDPAFVDVDYKETNYLQHLITQKETVTSLLKDRIQKYNLAKMKWKEIIDIEKKLRNTIMLLKQQEKQISTQIQKAEEMKFEARGCHQR
jgi:biopolymer transport protein ExbB/TolQ